ncbi:hypothetical protein LTR17_023484 [Elasticomyces elasticus]|nr:hypothetical protein LTR17_023484 [Elasticomyces elasticus]
MATDRVGERFDRAFAELHQLFEDDKIVECVVLAQDLLEHRIKVLIMLSSCAADWRDAEACRLEAEQLWSFLRDALAHLRLCLDPCNEVPREEKPEYDAKMLRLQEEGEIEDMAQGGASSERVVEASFDDPVELAKAQADDEDELGRSDELATRQMGDVCRVVQRLVTNLHDRPAGLKPAQGTGTSFITLSAHAMGP